MIRLLKCLGILALMLTIYSCKVSQKVVKLEPKSPQSSISVGDSMSILVPGIWKTSSVNNLSNQYFIRNEDSSLVSISINSIEKYPFHVSKMEDSTFVNQLYNWESSHFKDQGFRIEVMEENYKKGYVMWKMDRGEQNIWMLYGKKAEKAWAINFLEAGLNSSIDRGKLLKQVFLEN